MDIKAHVQQSWNKVQVFSPATTWNLGVSIRLSRREGLASLNGRRMQSQAVNIREEGAVVDSL